MTPQEKLSSRRWRLLHSAWVFWSVLGLGYLTWVGFLIGWRRVKTRSWLAATVAWGVFTVVLVVLTSTVDIGTEANPADSPAANFYFVYYLLGWIGGIVHSVTWNRQFLRARAAVADAAWYQVGVSEGPQVVPGAGQQPGTSASPPEVDAALRADVPIATPGAQASAASQKVDVSTATATELATALELNSTLASQIVAARRRTGGFRALEDLMTEAQIPPHVFASIRDRIVVGSPTTSNDSPNRGRRLDL